MKAEFIFNAVEGEPDKGFTRISLDGDDPPLWPPGSGVVRIAMYQPKQEGKPGQLVTLEDVPLSEWLVMCRMFCGLEAVKGGGK